MRHRLSGLKLFTALAAATFLAACSTPAEETADTSGQTQAQPAAPQQQAAPRTDSTPAIIPGSQEDLVLNVGDRVFFAYDRYDLDSEAQDALERQAAWMNKYPQVTVIVEGHCDERGTREYNLALGERRANAVKEYLVSLGVNPGRVETISYGKERPIALSHTESSWSQNRRGVTAVKG